MRRAWQLDSKAPNAAVRLALENVLVWHDEPQVATALDATGARYLGVATDDSDDGEIVRWVYAQITNLEYQALLTGGTTVREALAKDSVIVGDFYVNGGEVSQMWRASVSDVPEDLRPTANSYLPATVRTFLPTQSREEQIVIDGAPIRESAISFADLGSVVSKFQELWDALYKFVYVAKRKVVDTIQQSKLLVASTSPGSFKINVRPQEERLFGLVFDQYRRLVELGSRGPALKTALAECGTIVSGSFREYMATINSRNLEVFAQSKTATSYVSQRKAARIVGYVVRATQVRELLLEQSTETSFSAIGYFSGYLYKAKKFEFVRQEDESLFDGDIEDSVFAGNPITRGLVLGSSATYRAEIMASKKGDKSTYRLFGFWPHTPPGAGVEGTMPADDETPDSGV